MQELQCVDCIVNFFENESDGSIRDFIFDLLFGDFYHQQSSKFILQLLFSYAISLEAQKTLESSSKWIITNIGNEIIQNIFEQLVKDHFLLYHASERDEIQQNLINLCTNSPLFASLFMSIILDMLANEMIKNQEKFLRKMFELIEIWIEKNPSIPLLAYETSLTHFSSYMLNPLPGLLYTTILYPMKSFIDILQTESTDKIIEKIQEMDSMVFKVHLISLKLIKDFSNSLGSGQEHFKLLNSKNLESIQKRLEDYSLQIELRNKENISILFEKLLFECLERLAQMLELCWQYGFTNCTKAEIRNMFSKLIRNISHNESTSLMEIVLSS